MCKGDKIEYGYDRRISTAEGCGKLCKGQSSMFSFGTNDFGKQKCKDGVCICQCETEASSDGSCPLYRNKGYRLYRFDPGIIVHMIEIFILNWHFHLSNFKY